MQQDSIIQQNLFATDNDNNEQKEITKIPEDLLLEDLKEESQKRPRQRKNSTNLTNKFKTDLISNNNQLDQKIFLFRTSSFKISS